MTDTIERQLPPPPPPPGRADRRDIRDTPIPVLAFVAVLVALGVFVNWWLVAFIGLLVVMIFLHELGHFIAAKKGGMKVTEFFIGFGPRLWSFTRGETEYGLKAIPAGAYVKVIGMHNLEEVPPEDEPRTYRQASYPRRMAVALAGSTMHFVQAFVILMILYVAFGVPDRADFRVDRIVEGSAAAEAGMQPGDHPLAVDGEPVGEFSDLGRLLRDKGGQPVTITYERDGEVLTGTAVVGERLSEEGADALDGRDGLQPRDQILAVDGRPVSGYSEFAAMAAVGERYTVEVGRGTAVCAVDVTVRQLPPTSQATTGFLGVAASYPEKRVGAIDAAGRSLGDIGNLTTTAVGGIAKFLTPTNLVRFVGDTFQPRNETEAECRVITESDERRALSIIGLGRLATDAGESGAAAFLELFVVFNVFIGLFNLLPSLPFDGGHAVIATYERIRSRRGRRYFVDMAKVMPVASVVTVLFVVIAVLAVGRDIYDPVRFGG